MTNKTSSQRHCLITGASRGIGLEFTRQLLGQGWKVTATARNPHDSEGLKTLMQDYPDALQVASLDVRNRNSMESVVSRFSDKPVDLLINNAGVLQDQGRTLETIEAKTVVESLETNAVAPLVLTQLLLPSLRLGRSPMAVFITSRMGSIADNTSGGYYAYRSSKAALNMLVKSMSIDLKPAGVTCLLLHPGWVKTDMGGAGATLDVVSSVKGMLKVIGETSIATTGAYLDYTGARIPW
jgi:NAD(P)-dependent dehydrogenase (short-subunit alcohol dehydrogenase family)